MSASGGEPHHRADRRPRRSPPLHRLGDRDQPTLHRGRRSRSTLRARRARRLPVHARVAPRDVPQADVDDAPVRRATRPRRSPTSATGTCSPRARPGSRWRSTCRPSSASTPTTRAASARSAAPASRSTRSTTCAPLFDGIPLDQVSTSMTINAPAAVPAAALRAGRRGAGRAEREAARHRPRTTC